MGSGYNTSLAIGRSTRRQSSERTPIHFYLNVIMYDYELECGHDFRTRTPFIENAEEHELLLAWCDLCHDWMPLYPDPVNQPVSNDEAVSLNQDEGILKERAARAMQSAGFLQTDEDLARVASEHGISVKEIRKINAGLTAPEGLSGLPEMCRAGTHELIGDNLIFRHGRRACRACDLTAQRARRAAKKTARSNDVPTHGTVVVEGDAA
jgi:hypothetical protein